MSDNFQNYNENLKDTETKGAEENFAPLRGFAPEILPLYMARITATKELRKNANIAGISLYLISVVSFLMIFLLKIGAAVKGSSETLDDLLKEPAVMQVYQIIFSVLVFTLPFIICYKIGGYKIREFISFKRADRNTELALFFGGGVFCLFANIAAAYVDSIFTSFGIDYSIGETDIPKGIFGFLIYTLSTAIVPAVLEEFALRGIVLGTLRKFGDTFALITTSICFGIMHGNFEQIPFAFMAGLILGFVTIKTGSLRTAMFIHFLNNFISVVFSYMKNGVLADYQNLIYVILLAVFLILFIYFINRTAGQEILKIEYGVCILPEKEKYKIFFLSIGNIVFVLANLIQAVLLCFE